MSASVVLTLNDVELIFKFDVEDTSTEDAYTFLLQRGIPAGYFTLNGTAFTRQKFKVSSTYGFTPLPPVGDSGKYTLKSLTPTIPAPESGAMSQPKADPPSQNISKATASLAPREFPTLIDARVVPYMETTSTKCVELTEQDMDKIVARTAAVVSSRRRHLLERRSAVGRIYHSDPTSINNSSHSTPTLLHAADFPRSVSKPKLAPILSEACVHLLRLRGEADVKTIEHGGLIRKMIITSTASGINLSVAGETILDVTLTTKDLRLARLCLRFSASTEQFRANFYAVKSSYDSSNTSPELVEMMR